jgi:hypothetical protein
VRSHGPGSWPEAQTHHDSRPDIDNEQISTTTSQHRNIDLRRTADMTTSSTTATGAGESNLINEALSRTRTRLPQTQRSEATRPARRVAIQARRQQARELGNLSLYGVR